MAKGFYISKLTVSNSKEKKSEISFTKGCNIIYGPSNTGKSLVVNCIDYALGSKSFNGSDNKALDIFSVAIEIITDDGKEYSISRKVFDNNKTVHVKCLNEPDSSYQKMKLENLSIFLLSLLGLEDRKYKIIQTKDYKTQTLTLRTLIGTAIIDEEKIIAKDSIFHNKGFDAITATLSAIYVFLEGKEQEEINQKDTKLQKARKEAVEKYIENMISKLDTIDCNKASIDSVDSSIAEINTRISAQQSILISLNNELLSAQNELNELISEKQHIEYRLDRYNELEQDYITDLQRADFIIDAENTTPKNLSPIRVCPICSAELKDHTYRKYTNSAKIEKEAIEIRLKDLQEIISQFKSELTEITEKIESCESVCTEKSEKYTYESALLTELISQSSQLNAQKSFYESINVVRDTLNSGVSEEYKELPKEYMIKEVLKDLFFSKYEKTLEDILSRCNYTDYKSTAFDINKMDIIPNNVSKQSQGKGYRAYLNSIVALGFMKFMNENAKHHIPFLILDSPLMSLKEVEQKSSDSMKTGLISYIINNSVGQVIIIENEIPDVDYSDVNLIEFTHSNNNGRYGFIEN